MVTADTATAIMIGILLAFTYFIIYKKNRLTGNMFYFLTGIGIMWKFNDLAFIGLMIFLASIVSMIYDFTKEK